MRRSRVLPLLVALSLAVVGCTTTHFRKTWRDLASTGLSLAERVVVVSVQHADSTVRRSVEEAVVARLDARGARGVASHTLDGVWSRDTLVANEALRRAGAEALITMRVAGRRDSRSSQPGWVGNRVFDCPFPMSFTGGHLWEEPLCSGDEIAVVETRFYELAGEARLLWTGRSETLRSVDKAPFLPRPDVPLLIEVAGRALQEMQRGGVLASARD